MIATGNSTRQTSIAHPQNRKPRTWYPRPVPGQPASEVRASQPRGVLPENVRAGDRFGYRILLCSTAKQRKVTRISHVRPCDCVWGSPKLTCTLETVTETVYTFLTLCECCGRKGYVDPYSLLNGYSLSCCGRWRGKLLHTIRGNGHANQPWQHSAACLCEECTERAA